MALPFSDPVSALLQLQGNLDRLLNQPGAAPASFGASGASVFPALNIFQNEGGLVVHAEVPGIPPENLSVVTERGLLTISGRRAPKELAGNGGYHRRERQFGDFSRTVRLPEGLAADRTSAECRNGILTVRIPRAEEAKPRQVVIRTV